MRDEPGDARPGDAGPDGAGLEEAGPEEAALEEELRELAARLDPVPDHLVQAAAGAYAWRTVDADLAELVFDSLADPSGAALVRGRQQERLLSFRAGDLSIEIEVTVAGSSRTLIGQLVPPQRAVVEIRQTGEVMTLGTDEFGRFVADSLSPGPVSLRCGPEGAQPPVVTEWVPI